MKSICIFRALGALTLKIYHSKNRNKIIVLDIAVCFSYPFSVESVDTSGVDIFEWIVLLILHQLGVDVSCEELNHFFTGKGKAALSGCAEWQQCFAVEKMLEFYYMHARDETLAKQIETMTMLASRGNEHHG